MLQAAPKLDLSRVTLCCVDCTPRLPWALTAVRRCTAAATFGEVLLFADRASLADREPPAGVRWVEIDPLRSIEAYSDFMIKRLAPHIQTSHMLIVQWDGFILNPAAWSDEFLAFDYIGAPWNHIPEPHTVGNGGFSLRSARLLEALQSPAIVPSHPEDICICVEHRAALEAQGMRFAPSALARRFAVEDDPLSPQVFGFHGPYHLPSVLEPSQTLAFVESLTPAVVEAHYFGSLLRELAEGARLRPELEPARAALHWLILRAVDRLEEADSLSPQALGFCKALIRHGEYAAAGRLLRQRRRAIGGLWPEPRLWLRLKAKALASALVSALVGR